MKRFNRLLITGAAGRLGTELRRGLRPLAETIRVSDRADITEVAEHEEVFLCDLEQYEDILRVTKDVDAIVHFGGAALETDFETILDSNIRGSYHIYEGARINRVPRVIYASSVHAVGYHLLESLVNADSPWRPDSLYGVSKNFVESLSRLYWDKFGIESLCLRIFSSFPEPADRRMLWSWLSFDDCIQYVVRGLTAPRLGHTIAFAISNNRIRPVDDTKAAHLGFQPIDNTDSYRAQIESSTAEPDPHSSAVKYLGGWFCDLPHPDDALENE